MQGIRHYLRMPRTLQGQLIAGIWLGMAAVIIPFNIISIRSHVYDAVSKEETKLEDQGQITRYMIKRWTENLSSLLKVVSTSIPVRSMDGQATQISFNKINTVYPARGWRLFTRTGELIAATNISQPATAEQIRAQPFFQEALAGRMNDNVAAECLTNNPCYLISTPVYALADQRPEAKSSQPVGVLSVVVNLKDTAVDSGMQGELATIYIGSPGTDLKADDLPPTLSLDQGNRIGIEILMVSRRGDVVFPLSTTNDDVSMQSVAQRISGPWAAIIQEGMKPPDNGIFKEVKISGSIYHVFAQPANSDWSVVVASDRESSLKGVYKDAIDQIIRQIFTLLLVSLVIVIVCRRSAKPIRHAAETIKEYSKGNFLARIDVTRDDEVGDLFRNINQTGASLMQLLNERLQNAITNTQLQTATEIQKQFIVQEHQLNSSSVHIAADFDPAYEIGADWYDVVHTDAVTYVVMADVCDKGIPSALFMSVFRSLLRYSLVQSHSQEQADSIKLHLHKTLTYVNNYMAENHGSAAMFATVFVAAYDHHRDQLHYINAGHEPAFIVREQGALEQLDNTGPVIGLFDEAQYEVKTVQITIDELLFTYTDGLIDARSPDNEPFSLQRVKEFLGTIDIHNCDVAGLLNHILIAVKDHNQDAEQFDDMTMMVMQARA